ncbi:hypothetical protein [Amycolatopsis magusensis]|uniref:hypothetical protein n=1 Tax=Amycolatopsis magusensis TaxID=882444 RepID=UPI0037A21297
MTPESWRRNRFSAGLSWCGPGGQGVRVAARGAHDRFHSGEDSSHQQHAYYAEAARRLTWWRHPVLAVDTGATSPVAIATYLTGRIADLVEGPAAGAATA